MKYQRGVYVTPDLSYGSNAPESRVHHMARSGLVPMFVYRSASGSTGFGRNELAGRVLGGIALACFIFDDYRGMLRAGFEFGEYYQALGRAFSSSSGGVAIFEPDTVLLKENERLPEFRRRMIIFEFKRKRGLAAIAPEPLTIVKLGLGTRSPALLDYLQEHCGLLLVGGGDPAWGNFWAISGLRDAKAYLLAAFASAQVPVFEVATERDLPVW